MDNQGGIPDFENEVRVAFDKQATLIQDGFDNLGSKLDENIGSKLDDISEKLGNVASLLQQMLTHPRRDVAEPRRGQDAEQAQRSAPAAQSVDRSEANLVELNKKRAADAQTEAGEFNVEDVYMTLVDPHPRSKGDLITYATAAIGFYVEEKFESATEAFEEDFFYWTGEHFKQLPRELSRSIRDCLLANEAVVLWKRKASDDGRETPVRKPRGSSSHSKHGAYSSAVGG